jgi:DNA-directed RNA polymerase specialized sigma24 family protein
MPITYPTLLAHLRRLAASDGAALTDAELIGRYAAARDAAAFEVLVWRHGPMVWATCNRLLRHEHDVEDAFQAAFLALAHNAATLGNRQAVAGWLHRVATNAALKLRAASRRGSPPTSPLAPSPTTGNWPRQLTRNWSACRNG